MRFCVHYDGMAWVFEVFPEIEDEAPTDTFEIDNFEDALAAAEELLEDCRDAVDPLAEIFDEDDR